MSPLLSLPDGVLKHILIHVSLQDRLGSCSLVHTRLHAAAVSATQQVQLGTRFRPLQPERAESLLAWLYLYGQHVTGLALVLSQPLVQLPCPNLLVFCLEGGSIQLGPTADGRPGVVEGITKLTRLELSRCGIADGAQLESLSRLVHLQHLGWFPDAGEGVVSFPDATLPCLQHLTHLSNRGMSVEDLCQLSALTALQELDCKVARHIEVSPSSVSDLALPASLTRLVLDTNRHEGLEAALLPRVPAGLRAVCIIHSEHDPEPVLSCIARLQCLTRLEQCAWDVVVWPLAGPAYSALTASSSLLSLELGGNFPDGVWPFVFRRPHQLPHLTRLAFDEYDGWDDPEAPWAFGAADLAALVSCCPRLGEIGRVSLEPGPHVSELRKLTTLTKLHAYCADGDLGHVVGTVEGLAVVTQLHDVIVYLGTVTDPLSVASLLPLTSLSRLTSLRCSWRDAAEDVQEHVIETRAGASPDVWLRLLELCAAAYPACQPTALRSLAQQLAEQRAVTAAQAKQIACLQAQLSAQQQLASGLQLQLLAQQQRNQLLQQQHVAAQQQLSAQQQGAMAEQGARIAALEGQLQQLLLERML